jgi:hypothetical protein
LKADLLEALINHHKMMSNLGNVDPLAQLHHGKSAMIVATIHVMRHRLQGLLPLGLNVARLHGRSRMIVVTTHLLLAMLLHGLKLLLTLLLLLLLTQDMQPLVMPPVIKPWAHHLALPLLLD